MTTLFPQFPTAVAVNEVAPRDGLQNEPDFVTTPEKVSLIDRLSATGLSKIEVTSFVSPKAIPNLADAREVMNGITRFPDVVYSALVPNERGCERALECKVDEINVVLSISESHNLANMRMTVAQSLDRFRRIMNLVSGESVTVNGSIATAFGCPFEGNQPAERILWAVESYLAMGMQSITLADTTGMAYPTQVIELAKALKSRFGEVDMTLHFHNTRGMGLANVVAGLHAGVHSFDASLGGIGGCPYAPGATGNICSEDLVHMLQLCGLGTKVKLDPLLEIARDLPRILGHDVPGQLVHSGKRSDLHKMPELA